MNSSVSGTAVIGRRRRSSCCLCYFLLHALIVAVLVLAAAAPNTVLFEAAATQPSSSSSSSSSSSFADVASGTSSVLRRIPQPTKSRRSSHNYRAGNGRRRNLATSNDALFTVDLRDAVCPDLKGQKSSSAPTVEACRNICAEDPGCDLYQWCPYDPNKPQALSCLLHDRESWTTGNWTRCYVSDATSSRNMCEPDTNHRWIGAAKIGSNRVPSTTTAPAVTKSKRGFSGFLGGEDGGSTCADSTALGLQNSWYYTWTIRTSEDNYCRNVERLWGSSANSGGGAIQMGNEFVPMIIGVGIADDVLDDIERWKVEWDRANVHYLLGYNEPDPAPSHPQSVEAAKAAQDWPDVQKIALSFDPPLALVSPAPASADFDDDGRRFVKDVCK